MCLFLGSFVNQSITGQEDLVYNVLSVLKPLVLFLLYFNLLLLNNFRLMETL